MRRVLTISAILIVTLACCSEKCPLEPFRDTCGDLYGKVCPPEGVELKPYRTGVLSLTGSCGLNCDLSFCLPALEGTGTGVLVVTVEDTVPVMLSYVFPDFIGLDGNEVPVDLGPELHGVVLTSSGGVKISAASTALALVMLNPFFGGTTVQERVWFASHIARHRLFEDLTADVAESMRAFPKTIFDGDVNPGVYEKVVQILWDLVCLEVDDEREPETRGPHVAPWDLYTVDLLNHKFVDYGVTVGPDGAAEPDSVFLLPGRRITGIANPARPDHFVYPLPDGRFTFEFFKGFKGFPAEYRLDPSHPGGLATMANTEHAIGRVVTMLAGIEKGDLPGNLDEGDASFVDALSEAVESGDVGQVVALCLEHVGDNPEDLSGWFGTTLDDLGATRHIMAATREIISTNMEYIGDSDARFYLHFYESLVYPVHSLDETVCMVDGYPGPCVTPPYLSNGRVSPEVGYTDTVFTFSVHYREIEGVPPDDVYVIIDGDLRYRMELVEGQEANGTYAFETLLPRGTHYYYFKAIDDHGDIARLPPELFFYGPVVKSYPVLSAGVVRPLEGVSGDEFAFRVEYDHADRVGPASIEVVIDAWTFPMKLISGRTYDGTYEYRAHLPAGPYTHHFQCVDSEGAAARWPEAGEATGPYVHYAPELTAWRVFPRSGTLETDFEYEVEYNHGGGIPPTYVAACIDGIPRQMDLKTGLPEQGIYWYGTRLTLGPHTCYFEARDTLGYVSRLPKEGALRMPAVYQAGGRNPDVKVAVHVRAHNAKAGCDYGTIEHCHDIVSEVPGMSVDAFPVFFDLTEYLGVEHGMTWPDWTYSGAWTNCADVVIGDIKNPGDGASHIWDTCHTGVAVPGYVWLYADGPGMVCVCPHPESNSIFVLDCAHARDEPIFNACAGVHGAVGDAACPPLGRRRSP
jgi:hypothetical protein